MKKSSLILLVCLAFACQPKEAQENTAAAGQDNLELVGNFGAPIEDADAVSTLEMVQNLRKSGTFTGRVEGRIVDVCTKKGCWMTLELLMSSLCV
ncbi:hypothetical protein A3SI_04437 [Nitritalea halalkaliphila LW7]|uniref:DUF4920 domain-containing protein n=1 Tax=Nitritalea halalkaliphila LW7 TaxID=1189621 RepID=I5C892_9BACT|nr:hypothetical protein A3SI_04437 [Nitritalea halalkaliphila LW7]